jgi:hypothetical protein
MTLTAKILSLLLVINIAAFEVDPAKTGKYFYTDFFLERIEGLHEVGFRRQTVSSGT